MATETKAPAKPAPEKKVNRIGLEPKAYGGAPSTLCSGCGHDSITRSIIQAFYEQGVAPHQVAKFSGIGCSSKTPAYFLGTAHGFNSVHGRMPAVATGANMANRTLKCIGVSGDGDTASIGLSHFCHLVRRNAELIYIIENNGVYGLTKGQFSATADKGSTHHYGETNQMSPIDCCGLALELGCGFVARSFSADHKQLRALLAAAIHHKGMALIDVISPCVTFNNHPDSTKSYNFSKTHDIPLHEIDFIAHFDPQPEVDMKEGEVRDVELYDGSTIRLRKLDGDHDPTSRSAAAKIIERGRDANEFITGLIYLDPKGTNCAEQNNLVDEPLASLPQSRLRPGKAALDEIMAGLM